jgi:hypothetical protein
MGGSAKDTANICEGHSNAGDRAASQAVVVMARLLLKVS